MNILHVFTLNDIYARMIVKLLFICNIVFVVVYWKMFVMGLSKGDYKPPVGNPVVKVAAIFSFMPDKNNFHFNEFAMLASGYGNILT